MYLRVDGRLCVPVLALEHSCCRSPIDTGEAHELADGTLLLGIVGWRHLVLASVSSRSAMYTRLLGPARRRRG